VVRLDKNDGSNHLHGGYAGFADQLWLCRETTAGLEFSLTSAAGQGGFPGNLLVGVRISLEADALVYEYEATTDADTPLNLTNHSYFNLEGRDTSILAHKLQVDADFYLPIDAECMPGGEPVRVEQSPFDLRQWREIGACLDSSSEQLKLAGGGYDHCLVLSGEDEIAARLYSPLTGLCLRVSTTEPGLQVYTANHLPGPRTAICLETQHFPDSPNQPRFPSTLLRAGAVFKSSSRYAFNFEEPA